MMTGSIAAEEKELRFTRSGQAPVFWLLAAVAFSTATTLLATAAYRDVNPALPHPAWALLPLVSAMGALRLAVHLTRHAYLILSPVGIEVFPFFRPAANMEVFPWGGISDAEMDAGKRMLTLHFNAEKTSGVHLSLAPIRRDRRAFLEKAVLGRIGK